MWACREDTQGPRGHAAGRGPEPCRPLQGSGPWGRRVLGPGVAGRPANVCDWALMRFPLPPADAHRSGTAMRGAALSTTDHALLGWFAVSGVCWVRLGPAQYTEGSESPRRQAHLISGGLRCCARRGQQQAGPARSPRAQVHTEAVKGSVEVTSRPSQPCGVAARPPP